VRFLLADDAAPARRSCRAPYPRAEAPGPADRILIVSPANLAFQWLREIKE
jgi:hypothetical protein